MVVHFHLNIHWFSFIKCFLKVAYKVNFKMPSYKLAQFSFSSHNFLSIFSRHPPSLLIFVISVGYTMADIRYKWNDGLNSVQVSGDVSLPQFKVLGHRQKTIEASLSTGGHFVWLGFFHMFSSQSLCVSDSVIMGLTGYFITFNICCLESGDCHGKHIPAVLFPAR